LLANNNPHYRDFLDASKSLKAGTVALNNHNQLRTQLIRSCLAGTVSTYDLSLFTLSAGSSPVWRLQPAQGFNRKLSGANKHAHAVKYPGMTAIAINQYSSFINSTSPGARALEGMPTGSGVIEFSGDRISS
jgi:hypothetical protein